MLCKPVDVPLTFLALFLQGHIYATAYIDLIQKVFQLVLSLPGLKVCLNLSDILTAFPSGLNHISKHINM